MKMPRKFQNLVLAENTGSFSIPWLCVVCLEYPPMVSTVEFFVRNTVTFVTVRQNAKEFKKSQYSNQIKSVLAYLVIYHEIHDFELDPRDKNFCSVTSHEPLKVRDFGKFPKKLGKSSNFAQKVIISVTKNQK